ncbi:hypothetical protein BH09VER1_BH09VER1_13680 [soil metagenome]
MKKPFWQAFLRILAALAFLAFIEIGSAASTWIVPSGNWTATNNWSGSRIPNAATDAIVDNGGIVLISSGQATAADIYLGYSGTGYGALNFSGGTLKNNSTFIGMSNTTQSVVNMSFGTWTNASSFVVGNLGTGAVTMTGGVINDVIGTLGYRAAGAFTITGGSWRNGSLYVGQVGSGVLTIAGAGDVQITGADKTLHLADGFRSDGTLNFGTGGKAGTLEASGIAAGLGNATVNFNHTGTFTLAMPMSGSITVNKLGLGTTVFTGSNSYVGTTTISGGTLQIGIGGTAGTLGTGAVVDNSNLLLVRGGLFTVANDISGTGSLQQLGTGTTVLTGNNNYSGTTTLTKGVLQIDTNGRLGNSALLINGGTMRYGAAFDTLRGFGIGTGGATLDTNGFNVFLTNSATGAGALTKIGAGTLTLTGSNSYAGITTISSGTLQVGDGANDGTLGGGKVVNNGALVITRAQSGTVTNAIEGKGSLSQTGPGTLTLAGANSYTGGTMMTQGGIKLGNAKALGSTSGSLALLGGTLDLNGFNLTVGSLTGRSAALITSGGLNTSTLTTSSAISGTYAGSMANGSGVLALVKLGSGTLTLSGSSSFTGGTTLTAGGLNINNANALGNGTLTIKGAAALDNTSGAAMTLSTNNLQSWNSNFTFRGSDNLNLGTGAVVINNTRTIMVSSNTLTVGGVISALNAKYGLTKTGTGTLLLLNNNTFAGQTTANGGLLQIGNGGTNGSIASSRLSVASSSQIAFNRSDNIAEGGAIAGAGSVRQMGSGTLTLTGVNSFTGGTVIDTGAIQAGNAKALGNGSLAVGTGLLDLHGFSVGVRSITGAAGARITNNSGTSSVLTSSMNAATAYDGTIIDGTGRLALVLGGSGTLALNGNNTYSLGTTLNSGELDLGNAHAIGSGTLTIAGGSLNNTSGGALTLSTNNAQKWNGNFAFKGSQNLDLGTGGVLMNGNRTVTVSGGTLTVGGAIAATSTTYGLTKSGTGTLVLEGNNTYGGATSISQGTLQIGSGGVVSSLATSKITDNGVLIFNTSNTLFYRGVISGGGSLRQNGGGLLFLSGANSYSGGTIVNSGTLRLGNLRALGATSGSLAINSGAVVEINGGAVGMGTLSGGGVLANFGGQVATLTTTSAATSTFAGRIMDATPGAPTAASLALVKAGAGTLILSGANGYTGGTTISAGKLQLGDGGSTGSILGDVTNDGILAFNYNTDAIFGGLITGRGSLQQIGIGSTLTLTGSNSYTGGTTIGAGSLLKLVDGSSFGPGKVTDNGALLLDFSGSIALANTINGTGRLEQDGAGLLILNGANTFSGGTVINSGTVQLGNARGLGATTGDLAVNDGALDLNDFSLTVGALSGTGASAAIVNTGTSSTGRGVTLTTTVGSGSSSLYAGTIQDGLVAKTALVKAGSGTLTLTGNNTYSGGTTINAGALSLGNNGATGAIVGDIVNRGTLIFNRSGTSSYGGLISGGGSVVQAGSGVFILSGSNTYTGGTTLSNGMLEVANDAALGKGNVSLLGGTLATDGVQHAIRINGNLLWDSAATIALTLTNDASSEFVSVTGQISLQGNSSLVFELNPFGLPPGHTNFLVMTVSGGFNGLTPANFSFVSNDPGFDGTFRVDGNNLWFDDGYEPAGSLGGNLQFGAVPEPSTYGLIALAFGIFLARRRFEARRALADE